MAAAIVRQQDASRPDEPWEPAGRRRPSEAGDASESSVVWLAAATAQSVRRE